MKLNKNILICIIIILLIGSIITPTISSKESKNTKIKDRNLMIVDSHGPYVGITFINIQFYGDVSGGNPSYRWS